MQVPYELKLVLKGSDAISIDPASLVIKLLLTVSRHLLSYRALQDFVTAWPAPLQ